MNPDPNPDYDATDEIEYFFSWLTWVFAEQTGPVPRPIRRSDRPT